MSTIATRKHGEVSAFRDMKDSICDGVLRSVRQSIRLVKPFGSGLLFSMVWFGIEMDG